MREGGVCPRWRPVILNPFSQLDMLRSPSILAVVGVKVFLACSFEFQYTGQFSRLGAS